jgi:peptidyl-prolyl cis-trans isomerase SurA
VGSGMDAAAGSRRSIALSLALLASFAGFAAGQAPRAPEGPLVVPDLPAPAPAAAPAPTPAIEPVSASTSAPDPFRDKQVQVVAYIGHDVVITDDEVWQMVRQRGKEYIALGGSERAAKEKALFDEELKRLIDREVVILEMTIRLKKNKKEDAIAMIKEDAEKQATRKLLDYRKANKFTTDEEFQNVLKMQGLSYRGLKRQLERDTIAGLFLQQQIQDKVKFITLSDVWDYYLQHPKEFAVEDRVKWQDLFVSFARFPTREAAKAYADVAWQKASAGESFPELVKQYGQGDSNLRGGDGIGEKPGDISPPELEPMILKMDVGQVSPLLQTATGFHIVRVAERERAGTKPFDQKVQVECRNKIALQIQKVELERMMDEYWRKYRPKVVGK